jgi:hypothetical protein
MFELNELRHDCLDKGCVQYTTAGGEDSGKGGFWASIFIIYRRLKVGNIECIMDVKCQEGAVNEPCKGC